LRCPPPPPSLSHTRKHTHGTQRMQHTHTSHTLSVISSTQAKYPTYTGLDVSETIFKKTSAKFAKDTTKHFQLYDGSPVAGLTGDCTLTFDVLYHLVEDAVHGARFWGVLCLLSALSLPNAVFIRAESICIIVRTVYLQTFRGASGHASLTLVLFHDGTPLKVCRVHGFIIWCL
jgi:hypothetical protein